MGIEIQNPSCSKRDRPNQGDYVGLVIPRSSPNRVVVVEYKYIFKLQSEQPEVIHIRVVMKEYSTQIP